MFANVSFDKLFETIKLERHEDLMEQGVYVSPSVTMWLPSTKQDARSWDQVLIAIDYKNIATALFHYNEYRFRQSKGSNICAIFFEGMLTSSEEQKNVNFTISRSTKDEEYSLSIGFEWFVTMTEEQFEKLFREFKLNMIDIICR